MTIKTSSVSSPLSAASSIFYKRKRSVSNTTYSFNASDPSKITYTELHKQIKGKKGFYHLELKYFLYNITLLICTKDTQVNSKLTTWVTFH